MGKCLSAFGRDRLGRNGPGELPDRPGKRSKRSRKEVYQIGTVTVVGSSFVPSANKEGTGISTSGDQGFAVENRLSGKADSGIIVGKQGGESSSDRAAIPPTRQPTVRDGVETTGRKQTGGTRRSGFRGLFSGSDKAEKLTKGKLANGRKRTGGARRNGFRLLSGSEKAEKLAMEKLAAHNQISFDDLMHKEQPRDSAKVHTGHKLDSEWLASTRTNSRHVFLNYIP